MGAVSNDQLINALAVNGTSVYVGGTFTGTSVKFGSITLNNTAGGSYDGFVAKLVDNTSSASFSWAQQISGSYSEGVKALAVSGSNVYAAGDFSGSGSGANASTFGSLTLNASGGGDVFVAKLVDAGTTASYSWAKGAGGSSAEAANALAVSGTSVICGRLLP